MVNNVLSSLIEIIRELDKKFPIYFYTISYNYKFYSKLHVLSMSLPYHYYKINYNYIFNVIVLVPFTMF